MERMGGRRADEAKESTLLEEWRPMSIDLVIVGPIKETMIDEDTCIVVKKTTSLQSICRIDVVHSIQIRLSPNGCRAFACSTRRVKAQNLSLSLVEIPWLEGPGCNWPAIPFRWRWMKENNNEDEIQICSFPIQLKYQRRQRKKWKLTIFSYWQERTFKVWRFPSTLAGLITKTP